MLTVRSNRHHRSLRLQVWLPELKMDCSLALHTKVCLRCRFAMFWACDAFGSPHSAHLDKYVSACCAGMRMHLTKVSCRTKGKSPANAPLTVPQGQPFCMAGIGDLLALFRCISCRYGFGTDASCPELLGGPGRVFTSGLVRCLQC